MQMTKRDTVYCGKLDCEKYVCLHNMFQQRNKKLLFPGAVGRQMVSTPARSCTLPAETRCPPPLGKRLLLHFSNTPACWATEQNTNYSWTKIAHSASPEAERCHIRGKKWDDRAVGSLCYPSGTLSPWLWSAGLKSIQSVVVLHRIYYILRVVT